MFTAHRTTAGTRPDGTGGRSEPSGGRRLGGADALVIGAEWKELRTPDCGHFNATPRRPVDFDLRTLYEAALMGSREIDDLAIGRRLLCRHNLVVDALPDDDVRKLGRAAARSHPGRRDRG